MASAIPFKTKTQNPKPKNNKTTNPAKRTTIERYGHQTHCCTTAHKTPDPQDTARPIHKIPISQKERPLTSLTTLNHPTTKRDQCRDPKPQSHPQPTRPPPTEPQSRRPPTNARHQTNPGESHKTPILFFPLPPVNKIWSAHFSIPSRRA
jgi:hypothetical protein